MTDGIATDVFVPLPSISVSKTCTTAEQGANNTWTFLCYITADVENLPVGHAVRLDDYFTGTGQTVPISGGFWSAGTTCMSEPIANGEIYAHCDSTTPQMNTWAPISQANPLKYGGTLQGSGGLVQDPGNNCITMSIPTLGLSDTACATIPLVIDLDDLIQLEADAEIYSNPEDLGTTDPVTPGSSWEDASVIDSELLEALDTERSPSMRKVCDPLVYVAGNNVATANCTITIETYGLPAIDMEYWIDTLLRVSPTGYLPVPVQGGMTNFTGLSNVDCVDNIPNRPGHMRCSGPGLDVFLNDGTYVINWTADIIRDPDDLELRNCTWLTYTTPLSVSIGPGWSQQMGACRVLEVIDTFPTETPQVDHPPVLSVTNQPVGECRVNRSSQNYECTNRISVLNIGQSPQDGPVAVTTTLGAPGVRIARLISGNGWSCGPPVGDTLSCHNPDVSLMPGDAVSFDVAMIVNGLRSEGRFEACSAIGVGSDITQQTALAQIIMNQLGNDAGPVDGQAGQRTYSALEAFQKDRGLEVSRAIDESLFAVLGIPVGTGQPLCNAAVLPNMPAPPLQCDPQTTVTNGELCSCRYRGMIAQSQTQCGCSTGFGFVNGQGCVPISQPEQPAPPRPAPDVAAEPDVVPDAAADPDVIVPGTEDVLVPELTVEPGLVCDPNSTRLEGDRCVCIDQALVSPTSDTTCGCNNGLPMIEGRCIPIEIDQQGDAAEGRECTIMVNDVCLKFE